MIATSGSSCAPNSFSAGAPPRTPLQGSSRRSPRRPSRLGRGTPLPIPHHLDAFGVSFSAPLAFRPRRLRRLDVWSPKNTYIILRLRSTLWHMLAGKNCRRVNVWELYSPQAHPQTPPMQFAHATQGPATLSADVNFQN